MDLDFFDELDLEKSTYEVQSVGRLYLNLAKKGAPKRWRRLLQQE